jgi:adenylate cyclase
MTETAQHNDSAQHTFMFADISGFARIAEEAGDEIAADLALTFLSTAGRLASEHEAAVVKCLGDGVMVHGEDAAEMIRLGIALHRECEELGLPAPIHVGLHTGGALERSGDRWGATVNIAARVADAAAPGEILLTDATRAAAGERAGTPLKTHGRLRFKNITSPIRVHAAVAQPAVVYAGAGP